MVMALPAGTDYEGTAIDFTDRSHAVDLDLLASFPAGYTLRRIDSTLAQRLKGYDYYTTMYGSLERAVEKTIGCCLMEGETIACEVEAGPLVRGLAELGVNTPPAYRGEELATAVCSYVIREYERLGYRAF